MSKLTRIVVETARDARTEFNYNCHLRRILPWNANTPLGCASIKVDPLQSTTPHAHDFGEVFLITNGNGIISVDTLSQEVKKNDLIFIPPNMEHTIKNTSKYNSLEVICIWGNDVNYGEDADD